MGFRIGETIKTLFPSIPLASRSFKILKKEVKYEMHNIGLARKAVSCNIAHVSVMSGREGESLILKV